MKKNLLLSGFALAAVLCAAGATLAIHQAVQAKAEAAAGSDVAAAIREYIAEDGTYTKKTDIFLTEQARGDMIDVFHAKHNVLRRTTYYDETKDALLMGDYDGGFASINSGYRKVDANMQHYAYAGDNTSTSDYFTNATPDYTVADTTPNAFFVNLSALASGASGLSTWTTDGSSYYYNFTEIALDEKGDYTDPFLKTVQFFAAPMLLQNTSYFTPDYVQIRKCTDWLSIRLYTSSTDNAKLTVYDESNGLLAEARVFKGLVASESSRWSLKGSWDSWTDAVPFSYCVHVRETEQYKLERAIDKETSFKVVDTVENKWYGITYVEESIRTHFTWDGENDANIKTNTTRDYTFYWKGSGKSLWVSSTQSFTVNLCSEWVEAYPKIGIYYWIDTYTTEKITVNLVSWPGDLKASAASVPVSINGLANKLIIVGCNDGGEKVVQSADLNIADSFSTATVASDNSVELA